MITAQVRLFATLRQHRPGTKLGEAFAVELPKGGTVGDLVQRLGLPEEEVKLVFVNGRSRDQDHILEDGDEVGLFPAVGGG
jgi:sulfur-carrier protein